MALLTQPEHRRRDYLERESAGLDRAVRPGGILAGKETSVDTDDGLVVETGPGRGEAYPNDPGTRSGSIVQNIGIPSYDGFASPVWTDTRNGNQDTYGGYDQAANAADAEVARARDLLLLASPNLASGPIGFAYCVLSGGPVVMRVHDGSGRDVRTLIDRNVRAGDHRSIWDRRDQAGRKVPAGRYFIRYCAPGIETSATVEVLP